MRKHFLSLLAFLFCLVQQSHAQKSFEQFIRLETKAGSAVIKLYNQTPQHRDNFIKLIRLGYFKNCTFNRIVKDFVAQGGDSDSLYTDKNKLNKKQHWIASEFNDSLFHKKGVLAMGRDDNPDKSSFSTQFYLVIGKKWSDEGLDKLEREFFKGAYKIPEWQRAIYKTIGGTPFLDQHYTVFGEIVSGMELLDKLNEVKVLEDDVPVETVSVRFKVGK